MAPSDHTHLPALSSPRPLVPHESVWRLVAQPSGSAAGAALHVRLRDGAHASPCMLSLRGKEVRPSGGGQITPPRRGAHDPPDRGHQRKQWHALFSRVHARAGANAPPFDPLRRPPPPWAGGFASGDPPDPDGVARRPVARWRTPPSRARTQDERPLAHGVAALRHGAKEMSSDMCAGPASAETDALRWRRAHGDPPVSSIDRGCHRLPPIRRRHTPWPGRNPPWPWPAAGPPIGARRAPPHLPGGKP